MDGKTTEEMARPEREAPAIDMLVIHLARNLVKDLFDVGADIYRPHRIQFMGGKYPDNEIPMGGYCEKALVEYFTDRLKYYLSA
jgi:hypothetical protein